MIRRKDLDRKISVRTKSRVTKNVSGKKIISRKKNKVHRDGSGRKDIVRAQTRGVFGMALVILGVSLLIMVLSLA